MKIKEQEDAQEENTKPDFSGIIKNNPVGFIVRENIEKETGGILSARYAANLDSRGEGVKNRFRVGQKIAYPVDSVVEFLESRAEVIG